MTTKTKYLISGLTLLLITIFTMGLFTKLFGDKQTQQKETHSPQQASGHKKDWDFYLTNVDDKLSSIIVDLGLHNIAPIKDQTNVVWVSIKMNNPRPDGLPSNEEFEVLGEIEDTLVGAISSKYNATYVGRLTSDGHRDIYFYLDDTLLYDKTISDVMVAYPKYHFDFGAKEDKNWSGYFDFLYPSPTQFQSIQNRRVIDNLENGGDNLTRAREVTHWIYFQNKKDREIFLSKIKADGFRVINKDSDKEFGELPYRLTISRIDKVDQNSVDEYVIYLWNLAQECNGDYDGWETSIEKD